MTTMTSTSLRSGSIDTRSTDSERPGPGMPPPQPGGRRSRSTPRQPLIGVIVAVVGFVAILILAGVVFSDDDRTANGALVLSVGKGEAAASCLEFDVEILATMARAFAGTVSAVEADAIIIRVDDWYTGGDAATVELRTIGDAQALLGGLPLQVGAHYLLSSFDNALSYCGYSGPATPELERAFDLAFGGR